MTSVEILSSPISNFRMARFYSVAQLELIENSGDEILDLVLDMFDVLQGSFQQSSTDLTYQTEFIDNLGTDHYCFGTSGKFSRRFILRHPKIFN
jgi:hypothetical protein